MRLDDFTTVTRARTLSAPTCDVELVARTALQLLCEYAPARPVRLLGVRVAGFARSDARDTDPGDALADAETEAPGAARPLRLLAVRSAHPAGVGVSAQDSALSVSSHGVTLSGEQAGDGPAIVLLHGLTATRRYVLMGSRLLERSGYRVVAYDARGHGLSTPAPDPKAYGYELLAEDLEAVLDALGLERALVAGASMGAHTAVRFALLHPERVTALG